jgi:hypothetical protein
VRAVSAWGVGVLLLFAASAVAAPVASAGVVLNEINCEGTDWIELVNTSDEPADISGWRVTDRPLDSTDETHRMFFPASTVIAPNDDLVTERGTGGFPFGISCGDDEIRLADAGGAPIDDVVVPLLTASIDTWGRYPNGTGAWTQTLSSEGAPNEPSSTGGDPTQDLAAWLFDPSKVVDIDLTLPPASIDALNADPDTYQPGEFSLTTTGASYGPLQVGVRLKGGYSFRPLSGKSAFKVKFNYSVSGQRFAGLQKLTLNNMVQDPSNLHEVLAYDAFRAAGVPAPRTGYGHVEVNGSDYGLYLNVETMDAIALRRWFDTTQHLYEGAYGTDVTPGGAAAFEVDEGSDVDRSDLDALTAAVNGAPGPDWSDGVASVADLEQMTRMWAVEKYTGHWDGYAGVKSPEHLIPNNYFLHSDDAGLFTLLPWGTDQTWVYRIAFDDSAGTMFDHCLADVSCKAGFVDSVKLARSSIADLNLDALAAGLAAELTPWQATDPRREYTQEQIADAVAATRAFIAARPGDVDAWLPDPPPDGPGTTDPPLIGPAAAAPPAALGAVAKRKKCKHSKRRARTASKCRKHKKRGAGQRLTR